MRLHASCVAINGQAVLLAGASGTGKSDLALRLIDHGAQLVADDQTELSLQNGVLIELTYHGKLAFGDAVKLLVEFAHGVGLAGRLLWYAACFAAGAYVPGWLLIKLSKRDSL